METTTKKKTRILFINPISGIEGFLPIGLASLVAVLQKDGFTVDLFDTTYYNTTEYSDREKNELVGEFIPVDMSKYGVVKQEGDYLVDLNNKIKEFKPHIIGVTVPTAYNYPLAKELIDGISDFNGILIVGGKYVTVTPEKFIPDKKVDIICIGEGETPILELCNCVEDELPYDKINNLWVKQEGDIIKNELGPLEDLDSLPTPSWDLFDPKHFFRPYAGQVYRYGHVELSRGCPHRCSYCINHKLQKIYKGKGKYYRKKNIPTIIEEVKYLKDKHDLGMIKFWDEQFLLIPEKELEIFAQEYKEKINLPFLIDARLDSVTERKAELLAEMGCVNVSCGVESGSEKIRKEVLDRRMSNEQIVNGIKLLNKYGIRTSTLNMLGLPFETRENVFETIEVNRISNADNSSVMILQPWENTKIREIAVNAGFMEADCENYSYTDAYLNMPQLPPEEIKGLAKTFSLYRKVPKIFFPLVRLCEKDGKWRNRIFIFLHKHF